MAGRADRQDCVRCFTPSRATIVASFAYEEHDYELPLCDSHAQMFDNEMLSWVRLAKEKKPLFSVPEPKVAREPDWEPEGDSGREGRLGVRFPSIQFPVTDGGVIVHEGQVSKYVKEEIPPGVISSWTFSERAMEWLHKRGLVPADVLWVIVAEDKLDEAPQRVPGQAIPNDENRVYSHGDLRVLVNPASKRVIGVGRRGTEDKER